MTALRAALVLASFVFASGFHVGGHHAAVPPWQEATGWPDRIIVNVTDDPTTSFAVTWRTDQSVGRTLAQIAPATPDARFDLDAETVLVGAERIDLERFETPEGVHIPLDNQGLGAVHYHSAVFDGLEPDTLYAFRVQGARGAWSEWFQTRTAPADGPVSFIYLGDAQNGIRSHWSRMIRAAFQEAPRASFILHAGDLVQQGSSDYDWAQWFEAGGFIHAMVPTMPVPGNHEYMRLLGDDRERGRRVLSNLWRPHFTLPEEPDLPESLQEQAYDVRVSEDLHVFVLNSAPSDFAAQAEWLDRGLSETDATWTVVTMHHPYFVPPREGERQLDVDRRAAFTPVIDAHDVDLVLVGHIHFYNRATEIPEDDAVDDDIEPHVARAMTGEPRAVETVYVISASGAKTYEVFGPDEVEADFGDGEADWGDVSLDRTAGNTPMFQVIEIDGDRLDYRAHMADGTVYDAFSLRAGENGLNELVEGEAAFGDTRFFSNTGRYVDWNDLQ